MTEMDMEKKCLDPGFWDSNAVDRNLGVQNCDPICS